ncbi:MAG TPA: hypothetical protein VFK52_04475 [Nocardioidaceae bacterium]|nr:hypothetical protein [Nocardioidaceae bacterium]
MSSISITVPTVATAIAMAFDLSGRVEAAGVRMGVIVAKTMPPGNSPVSLAAGAPTT